MRGHVVLGGREPARDQDAPPRSERARFSGLRSGAPSVLEVIARSMALAMEFGFLLDRERTLLSDWIFGA